MDNTNQLTFAAARADFYMVERLVNNGFDINKKDGNGDTALLCATRNGNTDVAIFLIERGAAIYEADAAGKNALVLAEEGQHQHILQALQQTPVYKMNNCLLTVILSHDVGAVKNHISQNADLNVKDADGHTPLMRAVICANPEITRLLIDARAPLHERDNNGRTALDIAKQHWDDCKLKRREVRKILEKAIQSQDQRADALTTAIASGNVQKVRDIFDQDFWKNTHPQISWEQLKIAAEREDKPMLRLLITWGAMAEAEDMQRLPTQERDFLRQCGLPETTKAAEPRAPKPEQPPTKPNPMTPQLKDKYEMRKKIMQEQYNKMAMLQAKYREKSYYNSYYEEEKYKNALNKKMKKPKEIFPM